MFFVEPRLTEWILPNHIKNPSPVQANPTTHGKSCDFQEMQLALQAQEACLEMHYLLRSAGQVSDAVPRA